MKQIGLVVIVTLSVMMNPLFADNPILVSLDKPFSISVSTLGGSVTATYTFTNNLPWTLTKPFRVNRTICPLTTDNCTATAGEFFFIDSCTGKKLMPKEQCTVKVTLSAKTTGQKSVQLSYGGYDNNVVVIQPALTSTAVSVPAGLQGSINFPEANPLPSRTFTNTDYKVIFTFENFDYQSISFTQQLNQSHPYFLVNENTCSPTNTTGRLAPGAKCSISGTYNAPAGVNYSLSVQLVGNVSTNKLITSTSSSSFSFNKLIGVDYNPNHYTNNYPFNFHDVFFTGTTNNAAATNVYAELQQLQDAGFTTVRSYQTQPYSWIDIIKQAHALGMHVVYEAVIPQLPGDTNYPNCPLGAQDYIPCAQATLESVIDNVTPAVFNQTVSLVFAGHENYCDAGNTTPPCTGATNITYLTNAVSSLQATLTGKGLSTPVSSALISGNLVTPSPSIVTDMQTLINSYSADAPLAFDPYPFQFGVTPANDAVWTPPLSTTAQKTNSLAWDYIQVVGSTTPPAMPSAPGQPFYVSPRVLLAAETGWATAGDTTGYACNSPGPCAPSVANASSYLQTLYQLNTNNFVETSGYNIGVLAFEAYDEPAKGAPTAEQHYGLFDSSCNQKGAGFVPNNKLVSATGCQGYINGTLLTISGTPPAQASFKVKIDYPSAQHPTIDVTIPANSGTSPEISSVTPWPRFLVYTGAVVTVSSTTSSQSCTTTATSVTPTNPAAITFSTVSCTQPGPQMNCSGVNCFLPNPY
jgi:hypothetical protein